MYHLLPTGLSVLHQAECPRQHTGPGTTDAYNTSLMPLPLLLCNTPLDMHCMSRPVCCIAMCLCCATHLANETPNWKVVIIHLKVPVITHSLHGSFKNSIAVRGTSSSAQQFSTAVQHTHPQLPAKCRPRTPCITGSTGCCIHPEMVITACWISSTKHCITSSQLTSASWAACGQHPPGGTSSCHRLLMSLHKCAPLCGLPGS